MVKESKRQTEMEGSGGGLLPAVEGHSLGTRYKGSIYENGMLEDVFLEPL